MSLRLLAIEPYEGKAFYEEYGKVLFKIRPLYGENTFIPTTLEQMQLVVKRESYQELEKRFSSINEVIEYTRNMYEQVRGGEGLKTPDDDLLKKVVLKATDDILIQYVQKAIDIWLPQGQFKKAKELYNDIKEIPNIDSREKLSNATNILHEKIEEYSATKAVIQGQISNEYGFAASPEIVPKYYLSI